MKRDDALAALRSRGIDERPRSGDDDEDPPRWYFPRSGVELILDHAGQHVTAVWLHAEGDEGFGRCPLEPHPEFGWDAPPEEVVRRLGEPTLRWYDGEPPTGLRVRYDLGSHCLEITFKPDHSGLRHVTYMTPETAT
jgi:hypothetical protein